MLNGEISPMRRFIDKYLAGVAIGLTILVIGGIIEMRVALLHMNKDLNAFTTSMQGAHSRYDQQHLNAKLERQMFRDEQLKRTDEIEWVNEYRGSKQWKPNG